jgi:hypothetical protein
MKMVSDTVMQFKELFGKGFPDPGTQGELFEK